MMTKKELMLAKALRKVFPYDESIRWTDDFLTSFQEVKEIVGTFSSMPSDGDSGFDFVIKDSYVDSATRYLWERLGGCVYKGEAELLGMILYKISYIGIMHSDLCKRLQEYENQLLQLKRLLEAEPRRIHLKSDNSSGLSCVITSDFLKRRILVSLSDGLNHTESPLSDIMGLTSDLGEFVCDFENTANILLGQNAGKMASYAFLGDLVYLFDGIAPNPERWLYCNTKEKYDIVKGWVKQYNRHK